MKHYKRFWKHGENKVLRQYRCESPICSVPGCKHKTIAKGLCTNHYALMRRNGSPVRTRIFVGEYMKDGYRYVLVGSRRYEPEHRLVMERFLGRKLSRTEHVHHVDGDTLNNSPSNLLIVSASEHLKLHLPERRRGQRGRYVRG